MDAARLDEELAGLDARARVERCVGLCGDDVILTTSFGPTAGVMLKLVTDAAPRMRVVTIRHGFETERTHELIDLYTRRFKLNLKVYDAPRLPLPQEETPEFTHFKRRVKFEPLQAALQTEAPRIWLSGVMHGETHERRFFPYARQRGPVIAVYPMLDWTELQAIDYCIAQSLPMNEDYYDPCKGVEQNKECGIHTETM